MTELYYPPLRWPRLTFLDLPAYIRIRIYRILGLVRPHPVDLQTPGVLIHIDEYHEGSNDYGRRPGRPCIPTRQGNTEDRYRFVGSVPFKCRCEDFPTNLLRVSRKVYQELLPLLWGLNELRIRCHGSLDLAPLINAGPAALANLRSLTVTFNLCRPCITGHNEPGSNSKCTVCNFRCQDSKHRLANLAPEVVTAWKDACSWLASSIQPNQLALSIICDAEDLTLAEKITAPLAALPALRGCNLRFGPKLVPHANPASNYQQTSKANFALRDLVRRVSTQATQAFKLEGHFPFERLPREIRLKVLEYTHLSGQANFSPSHQKLRFKSGEMRYRDTHLSRQPTCCMGCNDHLDHCFCPHYRGSASTTCQCRRIPFELFYVSKQMHEEAEYLLFSQNTFRFHQDFILTHKFLQSLSPAALASIMRMEIQFEGCQVNIFAQKRNYIRDQWVPLLKFMSRYMAFTSLSLMIDCRHGLGRRDSVSCGRMLFERILQELRRLPERPVEFFFLSKFGGPELDFELERLVMGEAYDNLKGPRHLKRLTSSSGERADLFDEPW